MQSFALFGKWALHIMSWVPEYLNWCCRAQPQRILFLNSESYLNPRLLLIMAEVFCEIWASVPGIDIFLPPFFFSVWFEENIRRTLMVKQFGKMLSSRPVEFLMSLRALSWRNAVVHLLFSSGKGLDMWWSLCKTERAAWLQILHAIVALVKFQWSTQLCTCSADFNSFCIGQMHTVEFFSS